MQLSVNVPDKAAKDDLSAWAPDKDGRPDTVDAFWIHLGPALTFTVF